MGGSQSLIANAITSRVVAVPLRQGASQLKPQVAIIVPCLNEEVAIGMVVDQFRQRVADCIVFVYDNGSTDGTVRVAREHGAVVRSEPLKGKGNVVRRMFADVEADIYVMVDGDATYDASVAPQLIDRLLTESLDMVTGTRVAEGEGAYRAGHKFGNWLLTTLVARIFGSRSSDMLSGYRVMSRRFVKTFPALSKGFEIETELTVHALQLRLPIVDMPTRYMDRPRGSSSKLSTFRDGFRILNTIAQLVREEIPVQFFSAIALLLFIAAGLLSLPIFIEYSRTGLVPRLPTAVLVTGLTLLGALSFACGLILGTVTRSRNELKRLHYLASTIRFSSGNR
jgi:glycosyltransferase involved in cell wall biosynthesis